MGGRALLLKAITFLGGIYFFLDFLLPERIGGFRFSAYDPQITLGYQIIGSMAIALGVINLLQVHGMRIALKRQGGAYSAVLLGGMVVMAFFTFAEWWGTSSNAAKAQRFFNLAEFAERIVSDAKAQEEGRTLAGIKPVAVRQQALSTALGNFLSELEVYRKLPEPEDGLLKTKYREFYAAMDAAQQGLTALSQDLSSTARNEQLSAELQALGATWQEVLSSQFQETFVKRMYTLLYEGLLISLGSAMFSLLAFYIASAAYRAFRIRSAESLLMMVAALLVMLGQIPFGAWISTQLPAIRLWLLTIPNSAAFRAIELGASVAGLAMAIRMWLSIESQSFSNRGQK